MKPGTSRHNVGIVTVLQIDAYGIRDDNISKLDLKVVAHIALTTVSNSSMKTGAKRCQLIISDCVPVHSLTSNTEFWGF